MGFSTLIRAAVTLAMAASCSGEGTVDEGPGTWLAFERFDPATTTRYYLAISIDRSCSVGITHGGEPTSDGLCAVEAGPSRVSLIEEAAFEKLNELLSDEMTEVYLTDADPEPEDTCTEPGSYHVVVFTGTGQGLGSPWFAAAQANKAETSAFLDSLHALMHACYASGDPVTERDAELERDGSWVAP